MNKVIEYMEENSSTATVIAARELGVSEKTVLDAIPAQAFKISALYFEEVMKELTDWGEMTMIVTNGSVIFEVKSAVPQGGFAKGYYNLHELGNSVGGHLMVELFDSIYFVDRPFMGLESLSVQVYGKDGNAAIKFYLGRGEDRQIKKDQKEKYLKLKKRFMQ